MLIWLKQLLVRYPDVALHFFGRILVRKLQEQGLRAWSVYGGCVAATETRVPEHRRFTHRICRRAVPQHGDPILLES
jgi:hypothetical protein